MLERHPWDGTDPAALGRVLAVALGRGGDLADVFVEERSEARLVLDDGIVRSASAGTVGGTGVRVLSGERTGYAFTEERAERAVLDAARTAAAIADDPRDVAPVRVTRGRRRDLYRAPEPGDAYSPSQRIALVRRAYEAARAVDPRIVHCVVTLEEQVRRITIASSVGVVVDDVQPMTSLRVRCVAEEGGVRTTGNAAWSARRALADLDATLPEDEARSAALQAVGNLAARPAPSGAFPVVLGNAWSGVLLHEAVGHGLEADFNRKGLSRYSGQIGERVASPLVTVIDDGTRAGSRGSLNVDDEGHVSGRSVLIENGILRGYLHDRLSARVMGAEPTGNGRRESYACVPMPRMTDTLMPAGGHDPEEIIRSVERGVYAVRFGGGQVEIGKGDFVFAATEAYLIEGGRVTAPLRDVTLIGNGPEVMSRVTMVGTDFGFSDSAWMCGKDGQSVPVGVGMPTVKISSLTVGGGA